MADHVVLFKMRQDTPTSTLESWLNSVRALHALDGVVYLHAGAALPSACGWTHALYGRYQDKDALDAYAVHPSHLEVVAAGSAFGEDKLAVDWEIHEEFACSGTTCGAVRVVFVEWKPGVGEDQVAAHAQALADLAGTGRCSSGSNFSPARAKGFQWGFAAQFGSVKELKDLQQSSWSDRLASSPIIERFLLLDFETNEGASARI